MCTFGEFESTTKTASDVMLKAIVSGAYYYMKFIEL